MSPLGQSAFDVQMAWPPAEQLAAQADWNAPPSASIAAIPGDGLWAVGDTTNVPGNAAPLIMFHR